MKNKLPSKIQKAVDEGRLIPFEEIMARHTPKEREEIYQRARYLKASMELRKLRKTLHLSQGQLAKKMSVKREFISRIESGKHNVTLDTLYRVAEVTGKNLKLMFR